MKRFVGLVLIGVCLQSFGFAKSGFEYGGTTLFLENTSYQNGYDDAGDSMAGRNVAQFTRTYLTNYYYLNDDNKIRLTLDSGSYGDKHSSGLATDSWVYVKYLYLESKDILGFNKVKVGQISTPWIGFEDKIWGYRMISKSLLDKQKVTNSADRGISVADTLGINGAYEVAVIGGSGYKVADLDNKSNLEARYSHKLTEKVLVSIGGGTGWRALAGDNKVPSEQDLEDVKRQDFLVANINYKAKKDLILSFTVYEEVEDDDSSKGGTITHASGNSATVVKTLWDSLDLIGRVDMQDPDILTEDDKKFRSIFGAGWTFSKGLKVVFSHEALSTESEASVSSPTQMDYVTAQIKF